MSKLSIRLRIDGGAWITLRGEKARIVLFFWRNRRRWLYLIEVTRALGTDEVKARLCDLSKEIGELLESKPGSGRRKLYRLRAGVAVDE